jgi:hypothetical protein
MPRIPNGAKKGLLRWAQIDIHFAQYLLSAMLPIPAEVIQTG